MRLGLQDKNRRSSGITQEQLQELFKAQAEELTKNFQTADLTCSIKTIETSMRNLDLNDNAIDIDTVSFGEKVELREKDGDVYMTAVSSSSVPLRGKATPVKIPVKVTGSKSTPAKDITKNDLLSLLRSTLCRL
ncbi:hypothetical protein RIR_jg22446.t2 [Rhizophagus irregularis DAOM 181602=DAOM 197198]|nr:hypothetical protein RIR_jg22446.t2 [Rhizophagus irregularis DAOM 181602=DAOM 197198]